MATGSYEESLPMEGIPDHTSLCPSRGRGDGGLGSSFPPRATREGERLHGRKKGKRQGCQRFDREAPWEDNAHVRSPAKKAGTGADEGRAHSDPPKRSRAS